ncbi:MAG: hypothetical protein FJ316_05770 [SAR202 cluster bacterium]|nr:hypothetical protein [SAR202 cluster bacterium]
MLKSSTLARLATLTVILSVGVMLIGAKPTPPPPAPDPWVTTGNAGTNPATHFLGTTDNQDLVLKTNGAEQMRIGAAGGVTVPGAFNAGSVTATGTVTAGNVIATGNVDAAGFTQGGSATLSNSISGNAASATTATTANTAGTATALAEDPLDCGLNAFANAIVPNGDLTCAQLNFTNLTGNATDAQVPDNITISLAATATALAADPADCAAGQFANAIAANGNLTCAQVNFADVAGAATDAQIPDNITVNLATTATALSNDATEPSRIQTWGDASNVSFSGTGIAQQIIDTTISVTVPAGKAYYYFVAYNGILLYNFNDRTAGSTGFYGTWSAYLLANTTPVSMTHHVVNTGYREDWSAVGASLYWRANWSTTWLVRLGEGTHNLKVNINGGSDNTMNIVHVQHQGMEVMRVN